MIHQSDPPILLRDVFEDVGPVVRLFERNAPYAPLGGWHRPGADLDAPVPLWFQNDWVHADLRVEGSEIFLFHELVTQAAREFYRARVIVPHSVYVNAMAAIETAGPAHTDNPRFQGRDRSNPPMWLLRAMYGSGLFEDWVIVQATSIWWMNDVGGGGFLYWPEGPEKPPAEHLGQMANTALVGDNHRMFHQVGAVGPFGARRRVSSHAKLAPAGDGSGDWVVTDRGEERYRAPLASYRVSVLWKADVYRDEAEQRRQMSERLSMEDVARIFDRDLDERRAGVRLDLDRIEDPGLIAAVRAAYPEPVLLGRRPSVFDRAA